MYHEFDEVRRIHQPYIDGFQRSKSSHSSNILSLRSWLTNLYPTFSELLGTSALQRPLLQLETRHVCDNYRHFPDRAHSTFRSQCHDHESILWVAENALRVQHLLQRGVPPARLLVWVKQKVGTNHRIAPFTKIIDVAYLHLEWYSVAWLLVVAQPYSLASGNISMVPHGLPKSTPTITHTSTWSAQL